MQPDDLPTPDAGVTVLNTDPLIVAEHYGIDYRHTYAQDSQWFLGLAQGKLFGSRCEACSFTYATPRGHCMRCGAATAWVELPLEGTVHTWTTCYYAGESFRAETPFNLVLVELPGADTLLMARLTGCEREEIRIGMAVHAEFRRPPQYRASDVYFLPA